MRDSGREREDGRCRRERIDGAGEIRLIVQKSEDRWCRREREIDGAGERER